MNKVLKRFYHVMVWCRYNELVAMADLIAGWAWHPAPPRPLIIYSNEAKGPIVDDVNCFGGQEITFTRQS